jgi:hypothetical protein
MRKTTGLSIILAFAALGSLLAATGGAASTRRTTQQFVVYSANIDNKDAPLLVQAAGPIKAIGFARSSDDARGTTVPLTFSFPKGKIFLKAVDAFNWNPDLATCTATEHSAGPYTITGGTGAYHGIRGHGTFIEHGAAVGARDTSGHCLQKFKLNYVLATMTSA